MSPSRLKYPQRTPAQNVQYLVDNGKVLSELGGLTDSEQAIADRCVHTTRHLCTSCRCCLRAL